MIKLKHIYINFFVIKDSAHTRLGWCRISLTVIVDDLFLKNEYREVL